ncbi:MAG: helix-hairpin-helix domain-containing protein [Bacteroidota bacterium]
MNKKETISALTEIPGVGKSIANDLWNIGIRSVGDLKNGDPEMLYDLSNRYAGQVQDRCLLYVFRCAVYYASTDKKKHNAEKLKWWNWKDVPSPKTKQIKKSV